MDIGVDVGGTFTDLVAVDQEAGTLKVVKVPSTPQDPSEAFLTALNRACIDLPQEATLVHGTTLGTNAILERKGARCGLITTKGFRDVLELRRRDRPKLYGLTGFFEPLIPRELRLEVEERINYRGEVLKPLSVADLQRAVGHLLRAGVEVIVVAFLHSYANPQHELQAREVINALWPQGYVVLSSEVLSEYREFERTSTAVVNGYVQPLVSRYLEVLAQRLKGEGFKRDLLLVQSNGGVMSRELAQRTPVNTILSGPAAGVIAGAYIAQAAGYPQAITCDMGGTSFDVSLVWRGVPRFAEEKQVEFGIPIRVPHIDITTIGAGGGSIAWIDRGGILRVGPQSAGADPGPACYGKGGSEPTVTDAHLLLGHINPGAPIGGARDLTLDPELARRAVQEKIARPLGLGLYEAARAILAVANSNMAGSIRSVSVERGYDPRDFILVAFGGAGPLHACALIREVDIAKALVPPYPGVTSALGCVVADFRHDFVQTVNRSLDTLDMAEVEEILSHQARRGQELLAEEGLLPSSALILYEADMAYEGQIHTIRPRLPSARLEKGRLKEVFDASYQQQYGYLLDGYPITLLNLRTTVIGVRGRIDLKGLISSPTSRLEEALQGMRPVFFDGDFIPCPVYRRERLPLGARFSGPAVVEQEDATVVLEPGMEAQVDDLGNILITTKEGRRCP